MIATSKISTQGLQINSSDTSNRPISNNYSQRIISKNARKQTKSNISSNHTNKLDDIHKLDDLFKISLNFENNFLKNLNNTYKESIHILDDTYQKSIFDLDESYKSSIQNLENTYNISKHNLELGYLKSKKTLESNFDKAFNYLKKNFEIKQQLDKEQEEKLKREKVIQQMYEESQKLDKKQSTSNISWKQFIKNRKQEIYHEQKSIQEKINSEKQKELLNNEQSQENTQEQRNQLILEKRLNMERLEFQKQKELAIKNKNESMIKLVENVDPVDITNFFLHKNIDSNNYKYALTIYSGIGSATKYLYKNNRPSISYTDDLDVSQGFINWKNVEYSSTSKFITLILYSNETKNDKSQTEFIKKPFVGNIKISNTNVLNTSLEYCKNPKVIINGKETKFQYQILLKFKVENKIELDSNINISWLLEF